jgi:ribonuclease HI
MLKDESGGIKSRAELLLRVDGGCEPKNPGGVATMGWSLCDAKSPKTPIVEGAGAVADGGPLATNNYGEYCSLYFSLKWLRDQEWRGILSVMADSKLLVEQVSGRWKCNAPHLAKMRKAVWALLEELGLQIVTEDNPVPEEGKYSCHLGWVRRELNERANELCHVGYEEYVTKKEKLKESPIGSEVQG